MTKATKISLIVLLAGVLVAGIGSGIAFGEFSSLKYEEIEIHDGDPEITATRTIEIPEAGAIRIMVPFHDNCTIGEDEAVSPGTIYVSARAMSPVAAINIDGPYVRGESHSPASSATSAETTNVSIGVSPAVYDYSNQMFLYKDELLQGLKEGVLYGLPSPYDGFAVEVRVNPADIERVSIS